LVGKTIEEIFPPLADTEIPQRYRQAAANGVPWETEQMDYQDERIHGAFEVRAFQTAPNSMAVMFSDVTERINARSALQQSEQRYRSIFNASAVALWEEDYSEVKRMLDDIKTVEQDVPGYLKTHPEFVQLAMKKIKFIDVNQWTLDLYEASSKEELFAAIDLLFPPDMVNSFTRELIALSEGKLFYETENHTRSLKGKELDLLINVSFPREGDYQHVIVSGLNITPLRQAEMALKHQNAFLESLNRTAVGMMAHPDIDELLKGITDQARQLFGAPQSFIYLLDETQAEPELVVRAISSAGDLLNKYLGFRLKANEGFSGRIFATGSPLVVADYSTWEGRTERIPDYDIFHYMIGVPLKAGERVIGVLGLMHSDAGRVFTENDLALVSRFADLASIALDNARLVQSLGEAEARYRQIVERVNAVVYMDANDKTSSAVYMSPQIETMLGYTSQEWVEDKGFWLKVLHPDDYERVLAEHLRTKRTKGTFSIDYRMSAKDGRVIWVHDEAVLTAKSAASQPVWFGILYDITARKQSEEALQAAEGRYRDLVEQFKAVFYIDSLDQDSSKTYISPQAEEMFGYSVAEWLSDKRLWLKLVHPDDFERVNAQNLQTIRTGEDFLAEYRMLARDGRIVWVRDESTQLYDVHGAAQAWQGVWIDITARKLAEEALRKSESQLRAIFDSSLQSYVFVDRKCKILAFNHAASERFQVMVGMALEEGADMHHYIPPGELQDFDRNIHRALIGEENVHSEKIYTIDGSTFWLELFYTPVVDDNHKTIGVFFIAIDITERKQTQEMLLSQQKMADLGTLAAGMAHELNSPLQVVTAASEGLISRLNKNGSVDPDLLRGRLEMINNSGWRCADIIRSVLEYSRASLGEMESHNLNDLIQDALRLIGHQLETWSNIMIKNELASELPPFICDHNQIVQVIINLLINARDAMPKGGSITLVTSFDKPNHCVVLKVKDTGRGIPEGIIKNIFDPFFTTKPVGEGTGLGLSIVMGIVNAHHGGIQVESPPAHGTTFTLYFPEKQPGGDRVDPPGKKAGRYDAARN
jgi:two-component system cell cycle sensor histidine kinase/response regulator CckA